MKKFKLVTFINYFLALEETGVKAKLKIRLDKYKIKIYIDGILDNLIRLVSCGCKI